MKTMLIVAGVLVLLFLLVFSHRRRVLKTRRERDTLRAAEPPSDKAYSEDFICFMLSDGSTLAGVGDTWVRAKRKDTP